MECNRDEAVRAKEIAERKFTAKDFEGAKRLALKAESLFPGLEGIPQMLATLEIYLSAETTVNGEKDWYSILSVNASADDDTIKKQYRKLALLLHPDKNKSIGAEGAFKLVSEAWSVLSDRMKRMIYDKKRNAKVYKQRPPPQNPKKEPPVPQASANGPFHFSASGPKVPPPVASHPNTFWTVCNRCKMQYEYLRVYLNHNLLCPNCHEPFLAIEIPVPTNGCNSTNPWTKAQQNARRGNISSVTGVKSNGLPHGSKQNVHWGAFPPVFSGSTETHGRAEQNKEEFIPKKKQKPVEPASFFKKRRNLFDGSGSGQRFREDSNMVGISETEKLTQVNSQRTTARHGGLYGLGREILLTDVRSMLVKKAKLTIQKKLEELHSASAFKMTEKEKVKQWRKEGENIEPKVPIDLESNEKRRHEDKTEDELVEEKGGSNDETPILSINVPDPDFHDFDSDRSEKCFHADQVWATYDDEDGMPRFYAMVQKVISARPFKVRLGFLNSKSTAEFGSLNWVGSGFVKTCGDFRIGKYEDYDTINIFSHPVRWEKAARGAIRIVPRKGDIWAMYRNWSSDWDEHTEDEIIYKYDMVEVVADFSEEGVLVAGLTKVNGLKTVYRRSEEPTRIVPKEETFRFSHQVPCYTLTGEEAENAPKGCFELDPAATPPELLRVDSGGAATAAASGH